MRRAFLLGGVAVLVAGGALAGQRSRGGDSLRGGERSDAAAPVVQEIAPGVARAVINGSELTVRNDNAISFEEVIADYGSAQAYMAAVAMSEVLSTQGADGSVLYANGAVLTREMTETPEQRLEERMKQVLNMSQTVNGRSVVVFADGVVLSGMDERYPGSLTRSSIPKSSAGGVDIWADGAVVLD